MVSPERSRSACRARLNWAAVSIRSGSASPPETTTSSFTRLTSPKMPDRGRPAGAIPRIDAKTESGFQTGGNPDIGRPLSLVRACPGISVRRIPPGCGRKAEASRRLWGGGLMKNGERLAWAGQTSRLLRGLLLSRAGYRRQWQERAERRPAGDVSQAGVARVIALHLWGSGERPDSDTALARNLKDRVRRALTGQSITPQTLSWFVEAFHMDPRDARALWATSAADGDSVGVISGPPPPGAQPQPGYQTVAL